MPERGEPVLRVADDRPLAPPPGRLGETGVDDEGALRRARHPDEEVERPRAVVDVVAEHEVVERRPLVMGVLDGEQLVGGR